jgi:hypothetical protein
MPSNGSASNVDDSPDIPNPLAVRIFVTSLIAESPAVAPPDAVADLRNVITSLMLLEEPVPLPNAVRGAVCRPLAEEPEEPNPGAERILLCSVRLLEPPKPVLSEVLRTVLSLDAD